MQEKLWSHSILPYHRIFCLFWITYKTIVHNMKQNVTCYLIRRLSQKLINGPDIGKIWYCVEEPDGKKRSWIIFLWNTHWLLMLLKNLKRQPKWGFYSRKKGCRKVSVVGWRKRRKDGDLESFFGLWRKCLQPAAVIQSLSPRIGGLIEGIVTIHLSWMLTIYTHVNGSIFSSFGIYHFTNHVITRKNSVIFGIWEDKENLEGLQRTGSSFVGCKGFYK